MTKPTYLTTTSCRVCGNDQLEETFNLGEHYVNDFPEPGKAYAGLKVPIIIDACSVCGLLQARHSLPQENLYQYQYWYHSGVNQTMQDALADITKSIERIIPLRSEDTVLDIGSNDGTLLRSYTKPCIRIGVEPANNLLDEGCRGIDLLIHGFWSAKQYRQHVKYKAKVITAIGMFYDLEDPNQFVADMAECLTNDGLIVCQLMCLKNMLEMYDVGNFCHEHLEYYSLETLMYLFNANGLQIVKIETNSVNGQSYRIYATKQHSNPINWLTPHDSRVTMHCLYRDYYACNTHSYSEFWEEVHHTRDRVRSFVEVAVGSGKRVWVYGASTKGNTILQFYGLTDKHIEGAADRSPHKWGRVTVGSNIPIYSEEDARAAKPDYFLVLPYTFIDEFLEREKEFTGRGGKFIVPLPKLRILP